MTKTLSLRSIDIPGIHRFGIGFDSMFDELMRVAAQQTNSNYPPHNVIKTGDETVTIEVAVAGFDQGEIDLSVERRILTVRGARNRDDDQEHAYLHRGISQRDFALTFALGEHVEVRSASVNNGILSVYLEREVPEEARPKAIAITYQN